MGHQNIQFSGHVIDSESDHGHSYLHPDPCIFYTSSANFPQPNIHSMVPPPGNQCNFNFHPIPERHDNNAWFYGMPPYNGIQSQHPTDNLDLGVASSSHYNPYSATPSGIRDFPVHANHGARDQPSLSSYWLNILYMDGVGGSFKRKNAEVAPLSYTLAGPSSSVAPSTARLAESDVTRTDAAPFLQPEYGGKDRASVVEGGSLRCVGNKSGMVGPASVLPHSKGHVIQGNYVATPVHLSGNPWLDMSFGANNGDVGAFAWSQSPNLPSVHGSVNGACVEAVNIGIQGYQVTAISRSAPSFLGPPIAQGNRTPPMPPHMQGSIGYNGNHPSQVAASSRRLPTFRDGADTWPTFLIPLQPTAFRFYRPHRREIMIDPNARYRNLPHLRVLPEDEVAILEIPGYREAGDSIDQHGDMRLDTDHMSYEELLALGEQIGNVGTGLTEEFIQNNLRIRNFISSQACISGEGATCLDQRTINFCVVCQTDYESEANIGILDCGHEYHGECIKKWLRVKNTCPVCKSTALRGKGKNL